MSPSSNSLRASDSQPLALLLVDDEPAVLQALRRLLLGESDHVYTAETGAQALACLEQTRIDVVISDIRMPGMRGTELLARIAACWPDTSRIALTGGADMADAVEAINNGGIFRWVSKPWEPDELRRTVREAAERAHKIQSTRRRLQLPARPHQGDERVPHTIKRFFKGESLFREGSPGHQVHFIRVGKVELSMEHEGRRILIDTRGAGDSVGVTAPILNIGRSLTAIAVELTETFCITQAVVEDMLARGDPLLATMMRSMAEQSRHALRLLAMRNPIVNPIESAACALDLMARAASPKASSGVSLALAAVRLPQDEVIEMLSAVTGMVRLSAQALLGQLASLNLVGTDGARNVYVRPGEVLAAARKLSASHGDALMAGLRAESELMTLEELASLVGVEKAVIHAKMKEGELPEELWAFKKSATLHIVNEKGRELFRERTPRPAGAPGDISDILALDRDTLGRALSRIDPDRLAMLLKGQRSELRERALAALSKRNQAVVLEAMEGIETVDEVQVAQIGAESIERIRAPKAGAAAD